MINNKTTVELNNNYKVYVHLNKTNGKLYIGITSRDKVSERWHHGKGYKKQKYFFNAIKKYGWDGFYHFVIFENLTKDIAFAIEKEMIKLTKSNDPKFGYNISSGGDGGCGTKWSDERKKKASEEMSGDKNYFHNNVQHRKQSEEERHNKAVEQMNGKKIKCLQTNEVFDCYYKIIEWLFPDIEPGSKTFKNKKANLVNCIKRKIKFAKYTFMYI